MSRQNGTRKQRAATLLARVQRGPSLAHGFHDREPYSREQAEADVRRWLESWVVPLVVDLIPELRPERQS